MENKQRRFHAATIETRNGDEDNSPKIIEGYAAMFDESTRIGTFTESIARGAFDGNMNDDVRALFNHDSNYPLARSVNGEGTLKLSVDEVGLKFSFEVGEQQYAQDLYESIQRGDVNQASFGFVIEDDTWEMRDGVHHRTINKVGQLFDVSPVTYPAYDATRIAARSAEGTTIPSIINETEEAPAATPLLDERREFLRSL